MSRLLSQIAYRQTVQTRNRLWFILLFVLLRTIGQALGQQRPAQFEFQHLQEKDGLSLHLVNCFLQDRDGFLWVGTFAGLNRYDGAKFTVFKKDRKKPNSLLNNTVHDLCEDQQGNIWMGLESGISCYEKKTGRFRNISSVNGVPLAPCLNVVTDHKGDLWFTSLGLGLFHYSTKLNTVEQFTESLSDSAQGYLKQVTKNGLVMDPHRNRLWLTSGEGIGYLDVDQKKLYNHRYNPERLPIFINHYCSALTISGDQLLYSENVDHRIIVYDLVKNQVSRRIPLTTTNKRGAFDLATIFVDRQKNIWASAWTYTVFYIDATTNQTTELWHDKGKPTSIAGNFFWNAWQHPDGSIWLGTVNGISITHPERAFYTLYDFEPMFPALVEESGINRLLEDNDGSWWIGTDKRGFLHYSPQTNELKTYRLPDAPDEFPYGGHVIGLFPYQDELFVLTRIGFTRFNKRTGAMRKLSVPPGRTRFNRRRTGIWYNNAIWVGDDDGQVFSFSPITERWTRHLIDDLPNGWSINVRRLLQDSKGDLWVQIYPFGLAKLNRETARFVFRKSADSVWHDNNIAPSINAGGIDEQGNVWMTSHGFGLWRYNIQQRTSKNWTESEGLAYDVTHSALPDRQGNIWVGSFNKFSVFTPAKNRFLTFDLPINEANLEYITQLFQLKNGHIMALLKGYMVEFAPEKLFNRPTNKNDRILIGQFDTSDSSRLLYNHASDVKLKAEDNSFSIHYAALKPLTETSFRYSYRLEGYDDDWKQAGLATTANYGKVPGGDYTFQVKGISSDGHETPVSTLQIHIDTPFYQVSWFWATIGIILIGLILGFLKFRADQIDRLHQLQVQATRLERDKSEIQYQNLINHLNPHFLFNSLTSLNSLISISPREASKFLGKLSVIYRYILQNKDKELVTLESELTFVQNYIDLQKSRFGDDLQISVDVPNEYLTRLIVPVTLQNLLENAIKHNIIDEESPLIVAIYPEGDYLCVANNLQKKVFVETSNKQGLASMKSMYYYLSHREINVVETDNQFIVKVPLLKVD